MTTSLDPSQRDGATGATNVEQKVEPKATESALSPTSPLPVPQPLQDLIESTLPALPEPSTRVDEKAIQTPSRPVRPIVIPQTTSSALASLYLSPFARCYAPELEGVISQDDFLRFVDGLNEAFIANPAFEAVAIAGAVLGGVPHGIAQIVGGVLTVVGVLGSIAMSTVRTKKYIRAAEARLFSAHGLGLAIVSTKQVMELAGAPANLPLLKQEDEPDGDVQETPQAEEQIDHSTTQQQQQDQDPRTQWLRALGDGVAELDFDVPPCKLPHNWLRKMGAWQARREGEAQRRQLARKQRKAAAAAVKFDLKLEAEVAKIETKLAAIEAKMSMTGHDAKGRKAKAKLEEQRQRLSTKRDVAASRVGVRQREHRQNARSKEEKTVQKIRWLVIVPTAGEGTIGAHSRVDSNDDDDAQSIGLVEA